MPQHRGDIDVGQGIGLANVLSDQKDAIIATTYADNYAVRGNAFQVQRRIEVNSEATVYVAFDTTALYGSGKRIFLLPLLMASSVGLVLVDTYKIDSYTGGTAIVPARINATVETYAGTVIKTGVTPSGTPGDDLRQYIVGCTATHQAAGGGNIGVGVAKQFPAGVIIVAKIQNMESSKQYFSIGLNFFEI